MRTTDLPPTERDGSSVPVDAGDVLDIFDDAVDMQSSAGDHQLERAATRNPRGYGSASEGDRQLVDPRLRARWIEVRRAEGRRRLRILCGIVATVAVAAIAYVIANSSLLGVHDVDVTGARHTPPRAIRAAAAIADGTPLLFLDTEAVTDRVEALPMVARARVSTALPSTVVIRVTERNPVAWVASPQPPRVVVVDRDGRVLERVDTPPAGVTQVVGVGATGAPGTHVARPTAPGVLARIPVELRMQALRFAVRATGPVLVLGGTDPVAREIRFGSFARIREKSVAALAVLDALAASQERVRIVDVQVPRAPVTRA